MKDLRMDHQLREEMESDLSLFAILSVCACLDSRMSKVTLFRSLLNFSQ